MKYTLLHRHVQRSQPCRWKVKCHFWVLHGSLWGLQLAIYYVMWVVMSNEWWKDSTAKHKFSPSFPPKHWLLNSHVTHDPTAFRAATLNHEPTSQVQPRPQITLADKTRINASKVDAPSRSESDPVSKFVSACSVFRGVLRCLRHISDETFQTDGFGSRIHDNASMQSQGITYIWM